MRYDFETGLIDEVDLGLDSCDFEDETEVGAAKGEDF
jgi:hypothetical protein